MSPAFLLFSFLLLMSILVPKLDLRLVDTFGGFVKYEIPFFFLLFTLHRVGLWSVGWKRGV